MLSVDTISTFVLLLTFAYSSATESKTPSKIIDIDDKSNWKALWKVLKGEGFTRTTKTTVFDRIVLANAHDRATAQDDGLFLFQGDIRMTKKEAQRLYGSNGNRLRRAVLKQFKGNRWSRNSLVYELHPSLNSKARNAIRAAIAEWEKVLPCLGKWRNIRYLRVRPKAYIQFYSGNGCNSPVGRLGKLQRISIGKGCENKIIAVHEIGHAMGMWHEQSRPDRDRYVSILWSNIIPEWRSAFRKITPNVVNSFGVKYDYQSVMHYPSNAFAKRPGLQTIRSKIGNRQLGNTKGLTPKDIEQVQRMYRCRRGTVKQKDCSDNSQSCTRWQIAGYCRPGHKYYKYVKKNCCKTCTAVCSVKDESPSCPKWSKAGYCKHAVYTSLMNKHCKKSCHC